MTIRLLVRTLIIASALVSVGITLSEAADDPQHLRAACEKGAVQDCFNLGAMYAQGRGVTQDRGQAVALYRKACDGGLLRGCVSLGASYVEGNGVQQDNVQGVVLLRKACDEGEGDGCALLGGMYEEGDVPPS